MTLSSIVLFSSFLVRFLVGKKKADNAVIGKCKGVLQMKNQVTLRAKEKGEEENNVCIRCESS